MAVNPPPDIWRYIHERFYEDYLDKYNSKYAAHSFSYRTALSMAAGDAKNEVPITNLAKIKFPGNKEREKSDCKQDTMVISGHKVNFLQ